MLMRDSFINKVFNHAKVDRNIIFMSADFGAAALDKFRFELPSQFIHAGISEQNMVDVGGGLAISGKVPVLYAMAPFLLHRAFEQIKSVICAMNLPVTFVSVGCGLGYDHATFTHFTPEDVAIAKSLNNMEVWTASDARIADLIATYVLNKPKLRYIRLERNKLNDLGECGAKKINLENGFRSFGNSKAVAIVSSGYLTHKCLSVMEKFKDSVTVFDLFRIKPLSMELIIELSKYKKIITIEEQLLEGGIGSGILESLVDHNLFNNIHFKRLGLKDGFDVFNGDRDYLHEKYGLDTKNIIEAINSD